MKRVKFYSKDILREIANICELLRNDNVYTVRTLNKDIANIFEALEYRVTNDGYCFVIERETEDVPDIGFDF